MAAWSRFALAALAFLSVDTVGRAQPYVLAEAFPVGRQYHVKWNGNISGSIPLPGEKGQAGKTVSIRGDSVIEYDERVLNAAADGQIDRTLREYRSLDFKRAVDKEEQQGTLRREVSRVVILRKKQTEVPFSPSGPMTLGELQLIRTDVFTPALKGLLPGKSVSVGDTWTADQTSVLELTDLDHIITGSLKCKLEGIKTFGGKPQAWVRFEGTIRGIDEDGNARHELDGSLYFDVDRRFISYVDVNGKHFLLDKEGNTLGKIEGRFTLVRDPSGNPALGNTAIAGLKLEPNADNTLLRFDDPGLGIRFDYPRNWLVAGTNPKERQIGIDENHGSGILLTVDAAAPKGNAVTEFQKAVGEWLKTQKAKTLQTSPPVQLQPGLTRFGVEAELNGQRVNLQYYVLQQRGSTATLTARLVGRDGAPVQADVERIARSVTLAPTR